MADIVTYRELAELSGRAVSTLRSMKVDGKLPEPAGYVGQSPYWLRDDVEKWVAARRQKDGDDG